MLKQFLLRAPEGTPASAPAAPTAPDSAPASGAAGLTPTLSPAAGSPPEDSPSSDDGRSADEKFDSAFSDLPTPAAPKPAPTPAASGKPASAPAASAPTAPAADVPQFKTTKELRSFAYEQHKRAKELEGKIADLEKLKTVVEQQDPKTLAERQALIKKSEDLQKRIDEYEGRLKVYDYESSDEYKTRFVAPYKSAVDNAAEVLKELTVTESNPETMEESERPANWQDFKALYDMPLGQQAKESRKMFGEAGPIVMQHISEIKRLVKTANAAKDEYRAKFQDIEKENIARQAQERENFQQRITEVGSLWQSVNKSMAEDPRGQAYWGQESGDKDANVELAKGFAMADKRFGPEYSKLPLKDKVVLDAAIRHRVAGFYKLAHMNGKLKAELAEKDEAIAKLRGSAPGKPAASGEATPAGEDDGDGVMDKFEKI